MSTHTLYSSVLAMQLKLSDLILILLHCSTDKTFDRQQLLIFAHSLNELHSELTLIASSLDDNNT